MILVRGCSTPCTQVLACLTHGGGHGSPSKRSALRCPPPTLPAVTFSVCGVVVVRRTRTQQSFANTSPSTALRFGACLGLSGTAVSYNMSYQNANNHPSAANWILPTDTSWVYSMEQRTVCIAENRSLCFPFYQPTYFWSLSQDLGLAFQLFRDVRNVRKCHRIHGSNWPDDFTVQVRVYPSVFIHKTPIIHPFHTLQVDVFLPNASSAQGNAPLATTVLQPYRRNAAPLFTPRNPTPANATVMVHRRPREPMPLSWFQDVYLFAMLNRKETYCPGTGTAQQALCRSNHGLMDGGNMLPEREGPIPPLWTPFNTSIITIVPAAFVNLTSPGRRNAIGIEGEAWFNCFDPWNPQIDCATLKPLAPTNNQWDAFAGMLAGEQHMHCVNVCLLTTTYACADLTLRDHLEATFGEAARSMNLQFVPFCDMPLDRVGGAAGWEPSSRHFETVGCSRIFRHTTDGWGQGQLLYASIKPDAMLHISVPLTRSTVGFGARCLFLVSVLLLLFSAHHSQQTWSFHPIKRGLCRMWHPWLRWTGHPDPWAHCLRSI